MGRIDWHQEQELNRKVAERIEAMPLPVSARTLREGRDWMCSFYNYDSPDGWWTANIGTDHGPPEDDDKPVCWNPALEPASDIGDAMRAIEALYKKGHRIWLRYLVDGCCADIMSIDPSQIVPLAQVDAERDEGMAVAICRAIVSAFPPPSPRA